MMMICSAPSRSLRSRRRGRLRIATPRPRSWPGPTLAQTAAWWPVPITSAQRQERRHQHVVFADRQDDERSVSLGDANRLCLRSGDGAVPEEAAVDAGGLQALLAEDAGAVRKRRTGMMTKIAPASGCARLRRSPRRSRSPRGPSPGRCRYGEASYTAEVTAADAGARDADDHVRRSSILGSETFSIRTSPAPYMTVPRIALTSPRQAPAQPRTPRR